ncbi:unnamed protein product [Orchesella dallaii]|uniref:diacylglycerol O-acyltransferase n=1 Tax=Orchesella dallaii TaxID=48710 RepID=A0ABP1RBD6_9HEXA
MRKYISTMWFTLARLILTILLILCSPILFFAYGVLLIYRHIVFKVAKYLDPQLGKMVDALSNLFSAHDVYNNSYTINIGLHAAGKVDKYHFVQAFSDGILSQRTPEGQFLYPELTQKIVTKFGYTFWRNLDNFKVTDHIRYLNESSPDAPVTVKEMRDLISQFGKTPLDPSRSPWEIIVIKNFVNDKHPEVKSAMILRLHHCMFDGYSVFNVFNKLTDNGITLAGTPLQNPLTDGKRWWLKYLVMPIVFFFRGPYELFGQALSYDSNKLIQTSKENFRGVMRFDECEPISLVELKEIKNYYGVSMIALTTGLVAGGLKKFLAKKGVPPQKIHMTFPLPVINHPDKLRNYFSGGIISMDLRNKDRRVLLEAIQKKFYEFRFTYASGLPECSMLLLRVFGSLPSFLVPRIDNVPLSSTLMHTSFPGPADLGHFYGLPIVDSTVGGSISKPFPVGTLCYSYNGVYKFGMMADACIFTTQKEAEEMCNFVYEEFQILLQSVRENNV